ncbi:MAG: hypothetical protein IJP10_00450 [Clostridia bacterium]|nr:hypothetical protein [Clostridia bacterium]
MDIDNIESSVVKVGICEYGCSEYRAFICKSDIFPGTGDYEDEEDVRNDREIPCFCVWFEDMTVKDQICAGGGYYLSFNEAIEYVEKSPGFKNWLHDEENRC